MEPCGKTEVGVGRDNRQMVKGCSARDLSSIPGLGRSPGEWQPSAVFLPVEFHGQKSLAGYREF